MKIMGKFGLCTAESYIGGVMVNMFASSVVDHLFVGGVMVSMFTSSVVDHVYKDCV
jgi:glutamate synthase domain-containing protein 2